MPYPSQGVFILDNAKRLNITLLKKGGYISPGHRTEGAVSWSKNFNINAVVEMKKAEGILIIEYNINGLPYSYHIDIISRVSNLDGKSLMWLFVCPFTNQTCRKLYFDGRHFKHRSGIAGVYDIQTKSKQSRESDALFSCLLGPNDIYKQLQQKHLKKNYKGGLTKKYSKLLKWKHRIDKITAADVEFLLVMGYFPHDAGRNR